MPNSLHYTNAKFGMTSIWYWPGLYTRANTETYRVSGDNTEEFRRANILRYQEGQYVIVLAGPIFYGIDESMRLYRVLKL